ncbi:MAG: amidohydrolase family protein [Alphaproteobacteria bacterium]|nr:amidohydrolase family protein [Alphaproteobacteria bacterium]
MSKMPLILPSDPAFYELPPPPGSEPSPSLEDRLAALAEEKDGETAPEEDAPPPVDGTCDSHVELHAGAAEAEGSRKIEDYLRVRDDLRLDRAVLVQADAHGFDHATLLEALEQLGADRARGVATVGPQTSDGELRDLDTAGCVATRFQMREPGRRIDWLDTDRIAARVHDLVAWDVDLQMDGRFLMEVEDRIRSWPGRVILDHIGCFMGPVSDRDPGFRALLRLIDADKVWVKLSGPEESDPQHPRYPHAERLARMLIRFAPERLVWGSNWPYPAALDPAAKRIRPNGRHLLRLLDEWCEDEGLRDLILIENARTLWRFPAIPESAIASSGSTADPGSGHM